MADIDRTVGADTLVDGRYRIVNRIGSGGMADVYCAEDQQLGRRVALKVLHRRFAEDQEFVERFRREASAAAGLQHPNVVQVFDRGAWDGTYYIAMEFLEGRSLKQIIREDGPLDPTFAIDIAVQVLRAARFAHKRGVIHRDIKPHNVIVDHDGRVKVTDFGIARAGASDMTETGAIMGTAAYLSPEQAQGHSVAATSDLYSVGIVLYEMLTARVPFEADSAVTIALKQVNDDPVAPRSLNGAISPELEDVVLRALQKDPSRRFHDADDFIEALETAREAPPSGPVPQRTGSLTGVYPALGDYDVPPPYDPYVAEEDRSWRFWAGLIVALVALLAIAGGAYLLLRPEKVAVPLVVKLDANTAATKINNAGLEAQIQEVRSADRPEDQVVRQRPLPGERVTKGSTVTIFVSTGPGQAEVPDVTDQAEAQARRSIQRRGFKVSIAREYSDVVDKGHVIETRPPARSSITIGSAVTLVVSRGRPRVAVPDVVGQDREAARAALADAELQVQVQEEESDKKAGTVLRQDPVGGTKIQKGDVVTITVAKEPSEAEVPDVVGAQENDALDALTGAGFRPRTKTVLVQSSDEDGIVVSQSPAANSKRKKGSRVTITVGRFDDSQLNPEGGTTPTPTPSPVPTP